MRLTNYLNVSEEEVATRKHNIAFGFSLGNKYFTSEHIRAYLSWAIEHTKEKIVVIIPDSIQAINYEVKNGYSHKRAMEVALRKGMEMEANIKQIINELSISDGKINVVHWDSLKNKEYKHNLEVITDAFEQNSLFRKAIVDMVAETPHIKSLGLKEIDHEKLALYIINELPVLINGPELDGIAYTLFPYPGFATLDYLAIDLQEGKSFPEITSKLIIIRKLGLIELYVE